VLPENSIEGVIAAHRDGAFAVEVDVRPAADERFVIVHDPVLRSPYYCSPKGEDALRVIQQPSESLSKVTFGQLRAFGFAQQKLRMVTLPTLKELLEHPELKGVRINLELKNDGIEEVRDVPADTYIRRFCAEMDDLKPAVDLWRIKSFDHALIDRLAELRPHWPLHYLAETHEQKERALQRAVALRRQRPETEVLMQGISVLARLIDEQLIVQCQSEGVHLSAWTVNQRPVAELLWKMGVRDLITDAPKDVIAWISALENR
jgi:glycerophosphoryl diester phosphodiesterase